MTPSKRGPKARWCSERCRVGAYNAANREAIRERQRKPARHLVCESCGRSFEQTGSGRNRRDCPSCGELLHVWKGGAKRAAERGAAVERFSVLAVFERDAWTCALCLGPIDPAARGTSRLSLSIDHVIPIERGGDHVFTNVQATHLACNLWKGRRTQAEVAHVLPIYSPVAPAYARAA